MGDEAAEHAKYPAWSIKIGWIITGSSLICIPLYMAYIIAVTPGNLVQVGFSVMKISFSKNRFRLIFFFFSQRLSKVLKPEERPDRLAVGVNCNYGTGTHV